jgi:SAM-dependent methyltransferase
MINATQQPARRPTRSTRVIYRYLRLRQHYHSPGVAAQYDTNLLRLNGFEALNQRQLEALDRLLTHAGGGRPLERALDLACGTGRLWLALAPRARQIVGCDIALPMLAEAEKKARLTLNVSARLLAGDAERLPFADGSFELVLSCRFLRHIPRPLRVAILREMARVSSSWVIVDPRYALHPQFLRDYARGLLSIPWRLPNYGHTCGSLDRELRTAGLQLERLEFLSPSSCQFLALARKR